MGKKAKILIAEDKGSISAAALSALADTEFDLVNIADSYYDLAIPIEPRTELNMFGHQKEKPTCERNHEYIKADSGDWECRFCKRKL